MQHKIRHRREGSDGSYYTVTELYAQSCMVWVENETTKCTSTPSAKQRVLGEMQCKCLHAGCLSGPPAPTGCWVV